MTDAARKGPTKLGPKLGFGGRPPVASAPAQPGSQDDPQEVKPAAPVDRMPDDVAEALAQQASTQANVASGVASTLAPQQSSKGKANQRPGADAGASVTVASLLAPPTDPTKDLYNPGYRYPRYLTEVIRFLAFQLRVDQQEIANELLYAALMDQQPAGVLANVPREAIKQLVRESYLRASGTRQ